MIRRLIFILENNHGTIINTQLPFLLLINRCNPIDHFIVFATQPKFQLHRILSYEDESLSIAQNHMIINSLQHTILSLHVFDFETLIC